MKRLKAWLKAVKNHIQSSIEIYQKTTLKGKIACILSLLFMGGGLLTHAVFKAMLKIFYHFTMMFYTISLGIPFILGLSSFRTLNVRLYSILLILLWIYFYLKNLSQTFNDVKTIETHKHTWFDQLKTQIKHRKDAYKDYKNLMKKSPWKTKVDLISPFVFMGYYQFKNKAWTKGILLLSIQVLYIIYMLTIGYYDMMDFIALDTTYLPPEFVRPSTFNMVYGLLALLITFVFIFLYVKNIKQVTIYVKNERYQIDAFLVELKALTDHKLYVTLLSFPMIGVLSFTILPLLFMILIAFTGYQGSGQHFSWQGFEVFRELLLISDNLYTLLSVVEWTLIWAFFATFTNYFGGILLATLINKKGVKGKKIWRTIFIITMATPQFVSLLIMNQMFAFNGPVNQFLMNAGIISTGINFWGNQLSARVLIIIVNMWVGIPYLMLLTSGILMNIPEELYEAAIIEGANKRQLFTRVTMPYMLFITTPLLVTGFIHNINNFNVIYLLTQGRPLGVGLVNAGGTDILITWLYQLTRSYRLYNLSAAIGIIIFIISASISLSIYRRTASYKREGEFA